MENENPTVTPEVKPTNQTQNQPSFDENKINTMIDTRVKSVSDNVLKSYFQGQGLSEDEVATAIADFKKQREDKALEQKQAQDNLTKELETLRAEKAERLLNDEANKVANELGIDVKQIPYIMKLADMSQVKGKDGVINTEEMKKSFTKVITDIPALKGESQKPGFFVGGQEGSKGNIDDVLAQAFGNSKTTPSGLF